MIKYKLDYSLNKQQISASKAILNAYQNNQNVVVDAVCGAGKTQMLYEVIEYALNKKQKVGISVCRKQLLYELYDRIKNDFNVENISLITGDIKEESNDSFIFLTCHQLKKYYKYFDLLIIDEVDAFPFCDNYKLETFALEAAKRFIFLSATLPSKYEEVVRKKLAIKVSVNNRFHYHKIPLPQLIIKSNFSCDIWLYKYLKSSKAQVIIFVSNINTGYMLEKKLRRLKLSVNFVSSKNITKEILNRFRDNEFKILISTTILERGVTFKNINVIIYNANHKIFDSKTLIQISGRVGRDYHYHDGDIYFLCTKTNHEISKCIKQISYSNEMSSL